jgi:hypothetical protein
VKSDCIPVPIKLIFAAESVVSPQVTVRTVQAPA